MEEEDETHTHTHTSSHFHRAYGIFTHIPSLHWHTLADIGTTGYWITFGTMEGRDMKESIYLASFSILNGTGNFSFKHRFTFLATEVLGGIGRMGELEESEEG